VYSQGTRKFVITGAKVRDITERQRSIDFVQWQWENTVLQAARKYALPSKVYADVVVDSGKDLTTVEKLVYDAIVQRWTKNSRPDG
jgi:uridine kinase